MDNQQLEHLIRKIDELVSSQSSMSSSMKSLTSNARKDKTSSSSKKSDDYDYAGNFKKVVDSMSAAERATDKFASTMAGSAIGAIGVMTGNLNNLQKNIESTIKSFGNLVGFSATFGVLAGTFGGLTDLAGSLTSDFQKLSDSGKQFSGGILDMAQAAFESGNTLSEYTEYMHKNSLIAASMANGNNGGLAMLAKKTRDAGLKFGEFGYSISELNDLTAQYADRRRATGSMETLDRADAHQQVINLARDTTALSKAFGISRDQLTKETTDTIKGNPYLVGRDTPGIDTMMSGMIGTGGPEGKKLANLVAMGTQFGMISDEYRDLVSAGPVGSRIGAMAMNGRAVAQADPTHAYKHSLEMNNQMYEMSKNKAEMNNLMQLYAGGNKEAGELLSYLGQLHQINIAEAVKDHDNAERIDAITKSFSDIGVTWSNVISGFSLGVSKGLNPLFEKFKDKRYTDAIENLMGENGPISRFGAKLGKFVSDFITPEMITKVGDWIDHLFDPASIQKANDFVTGLFSGDVTTNLQKWLADTVHSFVDTLFGEGTWAQMVVAKDNIVSILGNVSVVADGMAKAMKFLTETFGNAATGLAVTWVGIKAALSVAGWGAGKLAGGAASAIGLGGGAAAAATAKGAASIGSRAIPGLGDILLGYEAYQESGSIGRGLSAGAGSLGGRVLGAAAGSAVLPGVGTAVGEVGGAFAGAKAGSSLYDYLAGKPTKASETAHPIDKPQPAIIDVNHPSVSTLLGNLSQSTQDALSPAMDQMANSISGTTELTNDKQTDAIVAQLDNLKRAIIMQTEVMAGILNDLNGTVKTGNTALDALAMRGH